MFEFLRSLEPEHSNSMKYRLQSKLTSFDRVELLTPSAKVKFLGLHQLPCSIHIPVSNDDLSQGFYFRTSVSIAKSGFQPSGGIILHIPYLRPSGAIFLMYSMGSRNSSSVGLKVGASCNPCGRILLFDSLAARGWPFLSTVDISRGRARRALKGMCGAYGKGP